MALYMFYSSTLLLEHCMYHQRAQSSFLTEQYIFKDLTFCSLLRETLAGKLIVQEPTKKRVKGELVVE